ncbi:hypothetical protein AGABI1DRAFT_87689 [Agaricus bisporus var. burnettii JB137-S8]|uniref:Uncharacterized protein n=1 Tax=Agaricus bisporus var. burnettii (strain JB137-S8 / ATCC MYA-4627 / FGSC 10392) TaxID=597362 RepID=K5VMI9_AGABU|nr:uncharacterized protein AGABI1DRAFT_87689 [Agaricus bisporus var. burnettii JB137-S8]EKM75634.1 hypothetical protein AGABI1DRAFT_87689 [Agaricus bisporus var. burnettii JB137-S8]
MSIIEFDGIFEVHKDTIYRFHRPSCYHGLDIIPTFKMGVEERLLVNEVQPE